MPILGFAATVQSFKIGVAQVVEVNANKFGIFNFRLAVGLYCDGR